MVFSSNVFLLWFLPIFLAVYFLTPRKWRNYTLLFASLLFYAYGAPTFLIQFLLSLVANFFLVRKMFITEDKRLKKVLCGISITISLGLLFYYKYGNFTMNNINAILGWTGCKPLEWTWILLPIGISFFSFQSITYTVDTYRGVNKPMSRLSDYMLYITMFPQLIAGPIIRYCDIADQITHRESIYTERLQGFYRFVIGLCKKILIADVIGAQVDDILGPSSYELLSDVQLSDITSKIAGLDSTTAWIVILGYTFQIYFDFSGYSDMAIGLGRMMGFRFPENFNNPYISTSISEFWKRWHITFNTFVKEYIYIPLGGNRVKTKARMYLNLWLCFLISGLWHGSSWNFVIWGALQGIFICADKLFLINFMKKLGRIPSIVLTFLVTALMWTFFRIDKIDIAWTFIKRLFAFNFEPIHFSDNAYLYTTMIVAAIFSFITISKFGLRLQEKIYFTDYNSKQHIIAFKISVFAFIFCLGALNATGYSPFIYFRF